MFWGFSRAGGTGPASFLLGSAYAFSSPITSRVLSSIVGWTYIISVALIAVIAYVKRSGIDLVGKVSTYFEIGVLIPVIVMTVIGLAHAHHNRRAVTPPHKPFPQSFRHAGSRSAFGFISGYEKLSTVGAGGDQPARNYPLALAIVVPMSIATYFCHFRFARSPEQLQDWGSGYFRRRRACSGGATLAASVTIAAAVANVCLLNSTVLATTRMPLRWPKTVFCRSN